MQGANQALYGQRQVIKNVHDLDQQIKTGINEGDRTVKQMTRYEVFYKLGLYFVIIALLIADVVILIIKLLGLRS